MRVRTSHHITKKYMHIRPSDPFSTLMSNWITRRKQTTTTQLSEMLPEVKIKLIIFCNCAKPSLYFFFKLWVYYGLQTYKFVNYWFLIWSHSFQVKPMGVNTLSTKLKSPDHIFPPLKNKFISGVPELL